MQKRCPYCGSSVEPRHDATGALVCPLCWNTGQLVGPASTPPLPPGVASGKAAAAMVLGINSVVLWFLGLILGPLALYFGISARREIARSPGLAGRGMATAGIVLGSIGLAISLILTAVFVAVVAGDWGKTTYDYRFDVEASGPGGVLTLTRADAHPHGFAAMDPILWAQLTLGGSAQCGLPPDGIELGDRIVCTTDGTVIVTDAAHALVYSTTV